MTVTYTEQPSFPLTPDESKLLEQIELDVDQVTHETHKRNGDLALALLESLTARKAVPEHRLKYFSDPNYSGLARGKSWKEVFRQNGNSVEETIRHPGFLRHLRYFIYGPELPRSIIEEFSQKVTSCGRVSSSDVVPLSDFARKQARSYRMNPHEADEEFYKLALDCGMSPGHAIFVKRTVRSIRYR